MVFQMKEAKGGRPFEDVRNWLTSGPTFLMAILLFVGISISRDLGSFEASRQVEFYVVPGSPETVVLGMYGDTIVSAHFERNTKTVRKDFVIVKLSANPALNLRLEQIGPLHLPK